MAIGTPSQGGSSSGGGNVNITQVGTTGVPTKGSTPVVPVEIVDGSGNQITSFGGSNASVSATAGAIPGSATYIAAKGSSNNLNAIGAVNQLGDGISGGVDGAVVIGAGNMLYNGTSWDRMRSGPTTGSVLISPPTATDSAVPVNAFYIGAVNGSGNLNGLHTADGDGVSTSAVLIATPGLYNGSNFDRTRSANTGAGTTGTGVLGAGLLAFDGTNFQKITTNSTTTTSKFGLDTNILSVLGTAPTTAGMLNVGGMVATNVAITDNPVNIGAQAISAENAAITATRKAQLVTDLTGKLIVSPYANKENFISGVNTSTSTSGVACIAAQGAGVKLYITSISIANTGSSTSLITIQQDPAGTPTTLWYMINPAGGGDNITFPNPLVVAANKAVGFTPGTASTTQYCSISGYLGS